MYPGKVVYSSSIINSFVITFDNKLSLCVRLSANALERSVRTATQALRHYGDAMPAASLCATPAASILNCTT